MFRCAAGALVAPFVSAVDLAKKRANRRTRIDSRYLLVAGSAALALLSTAASAQDGAGEAMDPAYLVLLGYGLEASYFDFDAANGFASAIDAGSFLFIRQAENGFEFDALGSGGNMHALVPLNDAFLGVDNFHFVFGGNFASDGGSTTIATGATEFLDTLPITGAISPGAIGGAGFTAALKTNVDFYRLYAAPTFGWGFGAITANFGPQIEFKKYSLDADFTSIGFMNLDEDVEVWSAGPTLAVMAKAPLFSGVEGFVGGQGSLLWTSGNLDAKQQASNIAQVSVSDSAEDLAFMGRGVAGISVGTGRFSGSLYGSAEWRNDMYEIVNPRSGPGVDANAVTFTPVHLDQTDMWVLSIGARVSVKLGGR
jgi:hypothetical protein